MTIVPFNNVPAPLFAQQIAMAKKLHTFIKLWNNLVD